MRYWSLNTKLYNSDGTCGSIISASFSHNEHEAPPENKAQETTPPSPATCPSRDPN